MTRLLESSGAYGGNLVVIDYVSDDPSDSDVRHVRIQVKPRVGEIPTLPFFPEGMIYVDRTGQKYTILRAQMVEKGEVGGERSIWLYEYLAAVGAHHLIGLQA